MDVSFPLGDVIPSAQGSVLAVLATTTTPLTGRKIAELTSPTVSQSRVAQILNGLADAGLVDRTRVGPAALFVLNRDHLAAPAIETLASLRSLLWTTISDHAATWQHRPDAIIVFGSTARGDGTMTSDIDLLVTRPDGVDADDPDWNEDLTRLASTVARRTGNPCEILDRSSAELLEMARTGESLLAEIRRDGRAVVGSLTVVPAPAR